MENFSGFCTLDPYEEWGHFSRDGVNLVVRRGVVVMRDGSNFLYGDILEYGEIVGRQA